MLRTGLSWVRRGFAGWFTARKRVPMTRSRLGMDLLEDRTLLDGGLVNAALTPEHVSMLRGGLTGLTSWLRTLGAHGQHAQSIALVNRSLDTAMQLGNTFQQGLQQPLQTYLGVAEPTTDGMVEAIQNLSRDYGALVVAVDPNSITGGMVKDESEIQFTLSFQGVRRVGQVPVNFGTGLADLGIAVNPPPVVTVDASFAFTVTFGLDLTPGLDPADAFFIRPGAFTAGLQVAISPEAPLNFAARLGFLGITIQGGTGMLAAEAGTEIYNPDGDPLGNVTLSELVNTPLADLVVLTPTANMVSLELPVRATVGNYTFPGTPGLAVYSEDVFGNLNPAILATEDLVPLYDFSGLNATNLTTALNGVRDYLALFNTFSHLTLSLPGLNRTLASISDHVSRFSAAIERLQANPPQTAQEVAQRLTAALAGDIGPSPVEVSFGADRIFRIGLSFRRALTEAIPFNLDFSQLGVNLPNFVNIGGQGNLSVAVDGTLTLRFGIDLNDPGTPVPVVFDTTGLTVNARATGTGLNFTAALAPLGIFVRNGTATLDRDGNPATPEPAQVTITLQSAPGGRYRLDELSWEQANYTLVGAASLALPLFFPTENIPLGGAGNNTLRVTVGNLNQIPESVQIVGPDLAGVFDSLLQLDTSAQAILDGLDRLLVTLQSGLAQRVFRGIPLVGNNLASAANFIENFRGTVMARLRQELIGAADEVAIRVQRAVFEALGPAGADLIRDLSGDGRVTLDDVQIVPTADQVQFNIRLGKTYEATLRNGFDVGITGLGLAVTADLTAQLAWSIDLGFGVHRNLGFYFDTSSARELAVTASVIVNRIDGTGRLLILRLRANDTGTRLDANFTVDVRDPNRDGKLTFAEMASLNLTDAIDARVTGGANVRLTLTGDFGSGDFPSVSADFSLTWTFGNAVPGTPVFGNRPEISFGNVRLNLGSFFTRMVRPILTTVNNVLGPIKPILDVLDACIPVISDLAGRCTKLSSLFGQNAEDFIALARRLVTFAQSIPTNTDNISIAFGSFDIGTFDVRTGSLSGAVPRITQTVAGYLDQLNNAAGQPSRQFLMTMGTQPGGGLQFPILQSPMNVFRIFLGQDVSLFTFDMPRLNVGFQYSQYFPFPPLPILGVRLGGGLNLGTRFAFGYDTFGIRQFAQTNNPLDIANGFFVDKQGTGIRVTGGIQASAELNLVVASAGVGGGIEATVDFTLNDPNRVPDNDPLKVRVGDIAFNLGRGPTCVFDVAGEVAARLFAYFEVGIWPFKFRKDFTLARIKLLSFNFSCPPASQIPPPQLAEVVGGTLFLNMGSRAARRNSFNTTDGAETYVITPVSRQPDGSETVKVSAFGFTQEYSGVRRIEADGGAGDDTILVEEGVRSPALLRGGAGDDLLSYMGDGNVTLEGGIGNDELQGGRGADSLVGGDGNDRMYGGIGNDTLVGGAGNDIMLGEAGNDLMYGDGDNDVIDGGLGNDSLVGGLGDDQLVGDEGDDTLLGDAGADTLQGNDGNDSLIGGAGANLLDGGAGHDRLYGGPDADTIWGNGGDDYVVGDEGADQLYGEVPTEEPEWCRGRVGCAPRLFGTPGNDVIQGNTGNDLLVGGAGNDSLYGGADRDTLYGQDGNDYLEGGAAADWLRGEAGNDTLVGGLSTGTSTADVDTLLGDGGNDLLLGDDVRLGGDPLCMTVTADPLCSVRNVNYGNDVLMGGDGNDTLLGGDGDDTLNGGRGQDWMHGEIGRDKLEIDLSSADGPAMIDQAFGGPNRDTLVIVVTNVADDVNLCYASAAGACVDQFGGRYRAEWFQVGTNRATSLGAVTFNFLAGPQSDLEEMRIDGRGGNDYITVAPVVERNLILDGGDGNDTLIGGRGRDILIGGPGNDLLRGNGNEDDLFGDDTVPGGGANGGNDTLDGGEGTDALYGGTGNDRLLGGPERDELYGQDGDDWLEAGNGVYGDKMYGGRGNDTLVGGAGRDAMYGEQGQDLLIGGDLGDLMDGGENDVIGGTLRGDTLVGETGRDTLQGDRGHDELHAFLKSGVRAPLGLPELRPLTPEERLALRDQLLDRSNYLIPLETQLLNREYELLLIPANERTEEQRTELAEVQRQLRIVQDELTVIDETLVDLRIHQSVVVDVLMGGEGNDTLYGSPFNDDLNGNDGDDSIVFTLDWANLDRFPGRDTITGGLGTDTYFIQFSDQAEDVDLIARCDGINCWVGVDAKIIGSSEAKREVARLHRLDIENIGVLAGGGDDLVRVQFGNQSVREVVIDGGAGNDRIDASAMPTNATLGGGAGNDTLLGTAYHDVLLGSTGMDSIVGGLGNDTLRWQGTTGNDTLIIQAAHISGIERLEAIGLDGHDTIQVNMSLVIPGLTEVLLDGGFGNDRINALAMQVPGTIYGGPGLDTIYGGSANDTLYGGADNDYLEGSGGADRLFGEDGNDTLYGDAGNDSLYGGNGNDRMSGMADNDYLEGGNDQDSLWGDAGNDTLHGQAGNDSLSGGDGNDSLEGQDGLDSIWGGTGADIIRGGNHNDYLLGGNGGLDQPDGNDTIYGDAGADIVWGGLGSDTIYGGTENDTLHGDDGPDRPNGSSDWIHGEGGNDYLYGNAGNDLLYGGANEDTLSGESGNDNVIGQDGHDLLFGGFGVDTLDGGEHNDSLYGGDQNDYLYGGNGNDVFGGGNGNDYLSGGNGNDRMWGDQGNDTLWGGANEDYMIGGEGGTGRPDGDDWLYGEDGFDTMWGGLGTDRLFGGNHNDLMHGDDGPDAASGGNDSLEGQGGVDTLFGNGGNDYLFGGYNDGEDRNYGGPGYDTVRNRCTTYIFGCLGREDYATGHEQTID